MARGGTPRRRSAGRSWSAILVAVGLSVAGCTGGPADPAPTAQALAAGLSRLDVSAVPFADEPATAVQDELESALVGMAPATLEAVVTGTSVAESQEEPVATVALELTWDLDGEGPAGQVWTYDSEATLVPAQDEGDGDWRVRWSRGVLHPALGETSVLSLTRSQADRADVVASDGTALVTARPVQRVGIDKLRLDGVDPAAAARQLADVVGVDADSYVDRVESAGDQAFVEAIVLREEEAAALRSAVEGIEGARLVPAELPLAPTREFARPLLGTVGPATAEVVDASGGAVAGTDVVGVSGLQARYDEQLRGAPGYLVEAVDDDGESSQELFSTAPAPGEPLVLTLDRETQQLADDILGDVDSPSAIVALQPSTGELLAVASGPGADGYSTATLGQYAPGSIFKTVTALALLRSGTGPQSVLPCPESVTIDGKPFTNYSGYPPTALGDIELRVAFAQSCNTAFVGQVDVADWPSITQAAASLGMGPPADLGFEAFLGTVGDPSSRVEQAAGLIGQGPVLVSPLGAAIMAASASVGPVTPVLVVESGSRSDEAVTVAPGENEQIIDMMRLAVTDGTADVLADVAGPPVAAKTGTAEFGTATPPDTHGWMVAVQGDLAVAVFVQQADSGSGTAGPLLRQFLTEVDSSFVSESAAGSP